MTLQVADTRERQERQFRVIAFLVSVLVILIVGILSFFLHPFGLQDSVKPQPPQLAVVFEPLTIPEAKPVPQAKENVAPSASATLTSQGSLSPSAPSPVQEVEPAPPQPPPVNPRYIYRGTGQSEQSSAQSAEGRSPDEGDKYIGDGVSAYRGVSHTLSGRTLTYLPSVRVELSEPGRVAVSICINREGKVVKAEVAPLYSTTTDEKLISLAQRLAREARFDANPFAPVRQCGRITFVFTIE